MSFISSLKIISVAKPDPNIFLWIAASVADTAAVNPNGIKTLLANGFCICLIKGNPVFSNGPKSLTKNPPDCIILYNWVFESFILADEPFAKALRIFKTYVLVNINLHKKLISSLEPPIIFDERFKVTLVPFFYCRFALIKSWIW